MSIPFIVIRHRSAVRIRGFHPRDRGSTPRVGKLFFYKNLTKCFLTAQLYASRYFRYFSIQSKKEYFSKIIF